MTTPNDTTSKADDPYAPKDQRDRERKAGPATYLWCPHAAKVIRPSPDIPPERISALGSMTDHVVDVSALIGRGRLSADQVPTGEQAAAWGKQHGKSDPFGVDANKIAAEVDLVLALDYGVEPLREYALSTIAGCGHPWAPQVVDYGRDATAINRPTGKNRAVRYNARQLASRFKAPPADLIALPAADQASNAATVRMVERWAAADWKAARSGAGSETTVATPEPFELAELLTEKDEEAAHRIAEIWPAGGRVLMAAQYKGGKSTMVGNAVKPLVDGGKFLGRFDVTPVSKVALIDTELDRRTLRRWLRDQNIRNTRAVLVVPLRGAVSTFDILDPAIRTEWAQRLAGVDVLFLDCLRPVLDALGLSEDKDAGRVLVAFDALLAEIGASEGMVVTHMGHQNGPASERARGDSRLLDWPDALWKIVRDGDETDDDGTRRRYFSALGRDVALPEGLLTFDAATRHLSYGNGNRRDSRSITAMPELLKMVRAAPGELSKNTAEKRLMDEHGIARQDARRSIEKAISNESLVVKQGPRNAQLLYPGVVDPFDAAPLDLPTGSEGR
ncbi:MAG: hypothetical protein EKK34_22050 [Mycobacterium sp.]|nr:MAG: hypothetical protein EKK34_22050 [Mycobacterium sp.]